MNWYYAVGGERVGPVDDTQLEALVQAGTIRADTLVWRDGLPDWQPYRSVRPSPPLPAAASVAAPSQVAVGANEVICAECGRVFSKEDTIQYGSVWVCGTCKPLFLQKLKEGAGTASPMMGGTDGMVYAGFWIRFGAKMIDILILSVVLAIPTIFVVISLIRQQGGPPSPETMMRQLGLQLLIQLAFVIVSVAYNTFFLGKFGATPGKMACGLKVVRPDGAPISFARSLGRSAAEILSGFICDIGYIIAAFDNEKRALHDHIATTRVVRK